MPKAVQISVVITGYTMDRWRQICAAMASVQSQTVAAREIALVIDNNDVLLERARREFPEWLVIANNRSPGLAGARNTGAESTSGDVIAYLDDDARATETWIAELQRAYESPDLLGVGGHISPDWDTQRPRWFPSEFNWVVGATYRGIPDKPCALRNPIGANMSILRSVYEAVGGFRETMGRLEETDFGIRASEHFPDRRWLHWPDARVSHWVSAERETWKFFLLRCHNEGLAKATMVRMTSRTAGLASERHYVRVTLPTGVLIEIARGLRGDSGGFLRAGAIVIGLGATALGYVKGLARLRRSADAAPHIARRGSNP